MPPVASDVLARAEPHRHQDFCRERRPTAERGQRCYSVGPAADGGQPRYRKIDFLPSNPVQLASPHIVTVEGLGFEVNASPWQKQAMIDHNGSHAASARQVCVAMTGLLESTMPSTLPNMRFGPHGQTFAAATATPSLLDAAAASMRRSTNEFEERYQRAAMLSDFAAPRVSRSKSVPNGLSRSKVFFFDRRISRCRPDATGIKTAMIGAGVPDVPSSPQQIVTIPVRFSTSIAFRAREHHGRQRRTWCSARARVGRRSTNRRNARRVQQDRTVVGCAANSQRRVRSAGGNIANALTLADSIPVMHVWANDARALQRRRTRTREHHRLLPRLQGKFSTEPATLTTRVRFHSDQRYPAPLQSRAAAN